MASPPKIRVAIIYGGPSVEHEVSILSARNVLDALDRERFDPVLIGVDKQGRWLAQDERRLLDGSRDPRLARIEPGAPAMLGPAAVAAGGAATAPFGGPDADPGGHRIDVVFPVMHGTLGEDGAMQGLFEVAGIPHVGAGVLGSAIGMDKDVMKRLLRDSAVPVAEFRTLRRTDFDADPRGACDALAALGFPLFTKPANAGSSVGVSKVPDRAALDAAVRHALEFDDKVIAEAAVTGREIELAVLGGNPATVSVAGEVVVEHRDGFYSYDAKYLDEHGARLELPAHIEPEVLARAQALALKTFAVLECEGMARVDLFLKPDGELLVNEINTLPGFTAISMYPKLWALSGVTPRDLITRLLELALDRGRRRRRLRRSVGP